MFAKQTPVPEFFRADFAREHFGTCGSVFLRWRNRLPSTQSQFLDSGSTENHMGAQIETERKPLTFECCPKALPHMQVGRQAFLEHEMLCEYLLTPILRWQYVVHLLRVHL